MTNKREKVLSYKMRQYIFATILLIFPIVLFLFFGIFGRLYSIWLAFAETNFLGKAKFIGFDKLFYNFELFFKQLSGEGQLLRISFFNSLKTWILNFIISMPLYYIFSYFIYKKTFGSRFVQIVSMLPNMISGLIFGLVFKQFINQPLIEIMNLLGDKDFPNLYSTPSMTYGLMIFYNIWSSFGMSVIFYANAMTGISPEIVESAEIDGIYNMFQELWYILLPMTFPTFKTMLLIGMTTLFTADYGLTTFFMYGAPAETWHMGYFYRVKVFNSSATGYPVLAASGILLTGISTPVVLLVRKWMNKIDPMDN